MRSAEKSYQASPDWPFTNDIFCYLFKFLGETFGILNFSSEKRSRKRDLS